VPTVAEADIMHTSEILNHSDTNAGTFINYTDTLWQIVQFHGGIMQ